MGALMCFLAMKNCLLIAICSESHFHSVCEERMFASHNRMLNKTIFAAFKCIHYTRTAEYVQNMCSSTFHNSARASGRKSWIRSLAEWNIIQKQSYIHATTSIPLLYVCKQMLKWRDFFLSDFHFFLFHILAWASPSVSGLNLQWNS